MKIYTKTGDDGTTGLFAGGRVRKDSARIRSYGDVDELNSQLGYVKSLDTSNLFAVELKEIQTLLFNLGADLATPWTANNSIPRIKDANIKILEQWIDSYDKELPALTNFILPGGSNLASALHISRTIARRAEREMTTLSEQEAIGEYVIPFINRLSDLLFIMARYANFKIGVSEHIWQGLS